MTIKEEQETASTENLIHRLETINSGLDSLLTDIEKEYNLKNDVRYSVRTDDGKVFDGYYIRCSPYYSTWGKELDIIIRFYKSKKDGEKSKVKDGFILKRIQGITPFPFLTITEYDNSMV